MAKMCILLLWVCNSSSNSQQNTVFKLRLDFSCWNATVIYLITCKTFMLWSIEYKPVSRFQDRNKHPFHINSFKDTSFSTHRAKHLRKMFIVLIILVLSLHTDGWTDTCLLLPYPSACQWGIKIQCDHMVVWNADSYDLMRLSTELDRTL